MKMWVMVFGVASSFIGGLWGIIIGVPVIGLLANLLVIGVVSWLPPDLVSDVVDLWSVRRASPMKL